jgi:L-glyceraldehyde 3-phosphate reductase
MGLEYVDIFYSHRFDPETPLEETMGALASAVRSGKALYVGISNYDAQQTEQAKQILDRMGVPLLIHQPKYSMFVRTPETSLFDTLGRLGVGSIVFSPLAQGLLTDRYLDGKVPRGSRASKSKHLTKQKVSEEYLTAAKHLNEIAANRGQSLAQLAIAWVLRQPTVTSALIGASSVKQLEQNHAAISGNPLTLEELAKIDLHARNGLV